MVASEGADGIVGSLSSPVGQMVMRRFWRVAASPVRGRGAGFYGISQAARGVARCSAAGQTEAMAILIRRTEMRTNPPILRNLRRMEPQVALANGVSARAMRRTDQYIGHRGEPQA